MADHSGPQPEQAGSANIMDLTVNIVSAYVRKNSISTEQLPNLIAEVNSALKGQLPSPAQPEPEPQKPAVPIRRSVMQHGIVCLECGKRFTTIRRHLRTEHVLEPGEYRAKWNLPGDYPMVAPEYAERRSALAKSMGLGRKKPEPAPSAKGRTRRGSKAKADATASKEPPPETA